MKTIFTIAAFTLIACCVHSQTLLSNGATVTLKAGGTLYINGDFTNLGGDLRNDGDLVASGGITNNQVSGEYQVGTLTLNGFVPQTLAGSGIFNIKNLVINNPAGVTLNTDVYVDGEMTFIDGVVSSLSNPLVFTPNASHSGVSDASHVNGFVKKLGIGVFTFPVGNGARYQPVTTDLTSNTDGITARYYAADAGTATFGTTGASPKVLEAYNAEEYWDIYPAGTATGKVTINWDDFENPAITSSSSINVFKVAHKTASGWLNEGSSNVTGNGVAGSVTSQTISSWSPFTLGVVSEGSLPVTMISFTAKELENQAMLQWQTTLEANASYFEVQRSMDGRNYERIGRVEAAGNSSVIHNYTFKDGQFANLSGVVYYRLRAVDLDATYTLTRALFLKVKDYGLTASVYPNPALKVNPVTIESSTPSEITVWSLSGRKIPVPVVNISTGTTELNLGNVPAGVYTVEVKSSNGSILKKLVVE